MIIFGWGHQTIKNYGITFKQKCFNCNNEDYWQLLKSTVWFTLFFIPIIPYEKKYLLLCPVCEKGVKIDNNKKAELINLAEANTELINKKITVEEYHRRLNSGIEKTEENKPKYIEGAQEQKIEDNIQTDNNFCTNCGNKINNEYRFCQSCGKNLK